MIILVQWKIPIGNKKIHSMKALNTFINEKNYDILGHELNVGDTIGFQSGGLNLYGEIESITDEERAKFVIKTLGWSGDSSLRSKVKEQYKVNVTSKSIYKVNIIKKNAH